MQELEAKTVALSVAADPIPLSQGANGVLRVGGTRVTLDTIVATYQEGATAETIAAQYDSLDLADIYAVLSYYLRHRDEVEAYLLERQLQRETVRQQNEARFPPEGVRERLLARKSADRRPDRPDEAIQPDVHQPRQD